MLKFDEVFNMHQEQSLVEFINICHKNELLNKMTHVCEEMRSNLARLIYIARKSYKDRLKYQIKTVLTEINLSENIQRFQEKNSHNIDIYLDLNDIEQKEAFEEIWEECFGDNGRREEEEKKGVKETRTLIICIQFSKWNQNLKLQLCRLFSIYKYYIYYEININFYVFIIIHRLKL